DPGPLVEQVGGRGAEVDGDLGGVGLGRPASRRILTSISARSKLLGFLTKRPVPLGGRPAGGQCALGSLGMDRIPGRQPQPPARPIAPTPRIATPTTSPSAASKPGHSR